MTDDQSFTFPSTAFPQLAAKSAFAYALAELRELRTFAQSRAVTILGEMVGCTWSISIRIQLLPHLIRSCLGF
jgi:hypothetical protein